MCLSGIFEHRLIQRINIMIRDIQRRQRFMGFNQIIPARAGKSAGGGDHPCLGFHINIGNIAVVVAVHDKADHRKPCSAG